MARMTRQRTAIRRAFEDARRPLGPHECFELASRSVPDLGIATVYRNINTLVQTGWLRVVELPGLPDRYETAGRCHHHHFHCRRCDGVFEVESCPGGFAALAPTGYRVEDHDLILYGVCRSCVG
jgi:Fur family transcriptional regulator, ferric uptake regulator